MSTFGQDTFEKIGSSPTVTADGDPQAKAGGVTIDWASVPAFVTAATFNDYDAVAAGDKFLRYGTILCEITAATDTTKVGKYTVYGATVAGGTLSTARGKIFILNESVHENDYASDHPPVIDGGLVFKKRINMAGNTTIVLNTTGPVIFSQISENDFLAAFPQIGFVTEN